MFTYPSAIPSRETGRSGDEPRPFGVPEEDDEIYIQLKNNDTGILSSDGQVLQHRGKIAVYDIDTLDKIFSECGLTRVKEIQKSEIETVKVYSSPDGKTWAVLDYEPAVLKLIYDEYYFLVSVFMISRKALFVLGERQLEMDLLKLFKTRLELKELSQQISEYLDLNRILEIAHKEPGYIF
ncbi:MAG: hypothetical protein GXO63_02745 [Candidatus Micrarchaeota archaeon]|nr:hypothetical protein [Candidatus Micrarchaeota archaeon]